MRFKALFIPTQDCDSGFEAGGTAPLGRIKGSRHVPLRAVLCYLWLDSEAFDEVNSFGCSEGFVFSELSVAG
jgi:hypothetical protein